MPDKMTTEQMIEWIADQDEWLPPQGKEAKAIIARLQEADGMEAWIKRTYGDWTDELEDKP